MVLKSYKKSIEVIVLRHCQIPVRKWYLLFVISGMVCDHKKKPYKLRV